MNADICYDRQVVNSVLKCVSFAETCCTRTFPLLPFISTLLFLYCPYTVLYCPSTVLAAVDEKNGEVLVGTILRKVICTLIKHKAFGPASSDPNRWDRRAADWWPTGRWTAGVLVSWCAGWFVYLASDAAMPLSRYPALADRIRRGHLSGFLRSALCVLLSLF